MGLAGQTSHVAESCDQTGTGELVLNYTSTKLFKMPLTKICPQCSAAVNVRKLACECGHFFNLHMNHDMPIHHCAEGFALQCFITVVICHMTNELWIDHGG